MKGWEGLPEVELDDGTLWPLEFAADILDIPVTDLRVLIRVFQIKPSGTAKYAAYKRQGRQPRVYPATQLVKLHETIYRFIYGESRPPAEFK